MGIMQGESLSPSIFSISINDNETIMNTILSMGVFVGDRKICALKYADDLVLCSVTSGDGLQAGVNALYEFCMINHLAVNTATRLSKVMYISRKSKNNCQLYITMGNH